MAEYKTLLLDPLSSSSSRAVFRVDQGVKIMNMQDAVVQLHYLAGQVEQTIGQGQLSEDLRKCADRLHELVKPVYIKENSQ